MHSLISEYLVNILDNGLMTCLHTGLDRNLARVSEQLSDKLQNRHGRINVIICMEINSLSNKHAT